MTPWRRFLRDLLPLLDAWDPIGVYSDPADRPPPGEYESAAPVVAVVCAKGGDETAIAKAVRGWAEEQLELTSDPVKDMALARAALALWHQSGSPPPIR